MSVFNPADITFNGEEVRDIRKAVWEKVFTKLEITTFHEIATGIKAKQQIAYIGRLGLVGKKGHATNCAPTAGTHEIEMSQKFWNPVFIEDRVEQCWKDLNNSLFRYSMKNGVAVADLLNTDFFIVLSDRLTDAIIEMIWRIVWFNDTTAALTTSSPAGELNPTSYGSLDYWNAIDGLWKQLFTIAATTPAQKTTTLSSRNGQATYAAQAFTAADTTNLVATSTLAQMKYESDFRLRDSQNLIYIATQSLVDQYAKELRSQSLDASYVRIEGGYSALQFEGINVIGVNLWDRYIRTYFNDGTAYYIPHRAILTTTDNFHIGVEEAGDFADMATEWWYERKDKKFYADLGMHIDAKVIEDYMVQLAY